MDRQRAAGRYCEAGVPLSPARLTIAEGARYDETSLRKANLHSGAYRSPMPHRSHFRTRHAGVSRWALVLRCLLLLAAWQGPVPWVHCHGTLAASSDGVSSWLAKHLQAYHPTTAPFSDACFGWHVHYGFPGAPSDDSDEPSPNDRDCLPVSVSAQGLSASWLRATVETPALAALPLDLHQDGVGLLVGSPTRHLTSHFFDAFAPSLPLPLRFCVLRT